MIQAMKDDNRVERMGCTAQMKDRAETRFIPLNSQLSEALRTIKAKGQLH